jgi:hypothetical protein
VLTTAAKSYGADGDPRHWSFGSLYLGVGLEGSAVAVFSVSDIDVTYT